MGTHALAVACGRDGCKGTILVQGSYLRDGDTNSCGCNRKKAI